MNRFVRLGISLAALSLSIGCQKATTRSNNGNGGGGRNDSTGTSNSCPTSVKVTTNDSTPVAGGSFTLYASIPGLMYAWAGPRNFYIPSNGGQDSTGITQVEIIQSGWYYCIGSVPNCSYSVADSVYIDVQYQQGSPSCALTNDQISNTAGLANLSNAAITETYDGSYNAILVRAADYASGDQYDFVFNSYNGNTEPKDGVYYTSSIPIFSSDQDADVINVNVVSFIYYFLSESGQKLYVSHVNGKIRISFCGLKLDDSSGPTGLFTGQVTAQ